MEATVTFKLEEESDSDSDDDAEPQKGKVTVNVSKSKDNRVVKGASVSISGNESSYQDNGQTNMVGMVTFENVPVGELNISVSKTGYVSETKTIDKSDFS
jgi:hypothetical protein